MRAEASERDSAEGVVVGVVGVVGREGEGDEGGGGAGVLGGDLASSAGEISTAYRPLLAAPECCTWAVEEDDEPDPGVEGFEGLGPVGEENDRRRSVLSMSAYRRGSGQQRHQLLPLPPRNTAAPIQRAAAAAATAAAAAARKRTSEASGGQQRRAAEERAREERASAGSRQKSERAREADRRASESEGEGATAIDGLSVLLAPHRPPDIPLAHRAGE